MKSRWIIGPEDESYATEKRPGENVKYRFDWSRIVTNNLTISSSTWNTPPDLIASGAAVTALVTTIFLAGGEDRMSYQVQNQITLSDGQTFQRVIQLAVTELLR